MVERNDQRSMVRSHGPDTYSKREILYDQPGRFDEREFTKKEIVISPWIKLEVGRVMLLVYAC